VYVTGCRWGGRSLFDYATGPAWPSCSPGIRHRQTQEVIEV
jgi:hypothetical protein